MRPAFEPAVVDKAQSRIPGPEAMSVYGSYEQMLDTLEMAPVTRALSLR